MNIFRLKPLVISIPVLLSCILAQTSQAGDNAAAVKSLDSITSQSSEIPSLLMETPVNLPDAEEIAPSKPKAAPMHKSAGYRLQTSQAQTDALNAQVAALKAEQEKKIAELAKQYASTQDSTTKAQQQKLADSEKQLADLQTKLQTTAQQLESANKQIADQSAKSTELQTKWQETTAKLDAQTKQMASLKTTPETPAPVSKEDIRAYALGAFWGHDVLNAMKKVESDGFKVSQPQVVSGVTDMMSGKFKIPKEKMLAELQEMDASVTAKAQPPAPTDSANNDYIAKFSKKPGVKKSEMGYYYRITQKGHGAIKNTDTVAIAVTESLANGKVIKDMNKSGKVLVLPLERFPPLFKTVISKMNNQGILQMVVPPELAYGEAGSPPNIPPNATMVYDVKVVSINPVNSPVK